MPINARTKEYYAAWCEAFDKTPFGKIMAALDAEALTEIDKHVGLLGRNDGPDAADASAGKSLLVALKHHLMWLMTSVNRGLETGNWEALVFIEAYLRDVMPGIYWVGYKGRSARESPLASPVSPQAHIFPVGHPLEGPHGEALSHPKENIAASRGGPMQLQHPHQNQHQRQQLVAQPTMRTLIRKMPSPTIVEPVGPASPPNQYSLSSPQWPQNRPSSPMEPIQLAPILGQAAVGPPYPPVLPPFSTISAAPPFSPSQEITGNGRQEFCGVDKEDRSRDRAISGPMERVKVD